MALIVIGLLIVIAVLGFRTNNEQFKKIVKPVAIAGFLLILLGIFTSCVIQIDAGEVGVQKLFGKVQNTVLSSGLHFINPLVDVVIEYRHRGEGSPRCQPAARKY